MVSTILTVAVLAILGISVLWGFLRGLAKARIRGICVLVCAIISVCVGIGLRASIVSPEMIQNKLIPWLEEGNQAQIIELLGLSETLNEVILNCAVSLVAPIICLVTFILLCFVTWFIFLIVTLILGGPLRRHNERSRLQRTRAAIWGLVQGLVIVVILLIPVAVYADYAPTVMNAIVESDALGENTETVQEISDTYIQPLNRNGLVVAYRAVGGNALCNSLTDFDVNGTRTHLSDELDSVAAFACNIVRLTKVEMAQYGSEEAAVFIAIADSFEDSVLLPTIAGEFIYNATDAWLAEEMFLGMEKPSFGEMSELFDPFFTVLLSVLHADAREKVALQADFRTVAEMVSVLAEKGVFANMSDTEQLMTVLGSEGVVNALIMSLGENESMKVLIPEITNLGLRAIATTLNIPEDAEAVYATLMTDITDTLNDVRDMSEAERLEALSSGLTTAFDEAGVEIDRDIVSCYAVSMMEDLLEAAPAHEDLTTDDVQAFFAVYALNMADETQPTSANGDKTMGLAVSGTKPLTDLTALLAGTVYEGKTEAELKKSGAAVLAKVSYQLSTLSEDNGQSVSEQASAALQSAYAELLESKPETLNTIVSIEITKPVSDKSLKAAAGLKSSEQIVTVKVTLNDLIVDSKEAAKNINSENLSKEAAAVTAIFDAANSLSKDMSGSEMKLSDVAGSVGNILDSLSETSSFGSEKTAGLFTAVLQSETVRKTADIDMATATQMAEKATSGNANYTQTMGAVSSGVDLFTKLGKDNENLTDAEIEALIRDINPQTAGMIEVYITSERIIKYGVPEKYALVSAPMLSDVFAYMANTGISEAEYQAEAKAMNQILTVAISAKSHSSGERLFGGILPTATETVNTFMSSKSVTHALVSNLLDENGDVKEGMFDPFELGGRIQQGSAEYLECVDALTAYYADHQDEETELTLKAVAALLGVSVALQ